MLLFRWITSSLRAKMLAMFVLLTAIPLILVGIITYTKSYNTVLQHNIASTEVVAEHLGNDIDVLFSDNRKFLDISKNSSVLRFLVIQNETYDEAKDILKTFRLYRDTYRFSKAITNITLFNTYGKGISEKKGIFQMKEDPFKYPQFVSLLQNPDKVLIIPPSTTQVLENFDHALTDSKPTISIVATVKQEITDEVIGFVVIYLDASVIEDFCNSTKIGETGYFYITDQQGQPIIIPDRLKGAPGVIGLEDQYLKESTGSYTRYADNQDQLVVYTTSELTGWKVVGEVSLREVVQDAKGIKNLIFISVLFTIIFTITLYLFVSSRLILPIRYLKNKMRQAASGYLDAKVHSGGRDEIADLGVSFNTMLDNIKILIEKSLREQEQIRIAEFRTLQAQINPHFLYNTLDSIIWLAENNKREQVIEMVNAFTAFFRISLSRGKDFISIKDEIEHISSYLTIQKMRYRDILDYEIHVDESMLGYRILKMTLQPLVENAIYHGIKNKRGLGCIRITGAFLPNGTIQFQIADNGAGIMQERLEILQASMVDQEKDPKKENIGFGMRNVHQRVRLYHGEPYGLVIESEYGIGTTVTLNIPVRREHDEENFSGR